MEAEPEASTSAAAVPTTEGGNDSPNLSEAEALPEEGTEEAQTEGGEDEEEAVIAKAQRLIDKILDTQDSPNPRHLHALATILEAEEVKYLQESTTLNNTRASHTIGRLGNLVRDNDEFYESISSKFLSESRYSVSVRAASARLVLSSASSWMYPHVFDDGVLDNVKIWVTEDGVVSDNEYIWKHELGANKPTDTELLRTYATGLLVLSMTAGGEVVEDILTSGLSAKLMRYLRIRVLGDASNQVTTFPAEIKHSSLRSREESRVRTRQISDVTTLLEGSRVGEERMLENPSVCLDCDRNIVSLQFHGDGYWGGGDRIKSELTESSSEAVGVDDTVDENVDATGDGDDWLGRNLLDAKSKHGERLVAAKSTRDEDTDENMRDELSRRRVIRGFPRSRLKVRINETGESERTSTSPCSGLRLGGNSRGDRDKTEDSKRIVDTKTNSSRSDFDSLLNAADKDSRLSDCVIGSSDISEMVRKAIKAAEAEARTAGAPVEAIKAAGDAAAELVKSAAMEVLESTDDQEAIILAASKAASTVVDAAIATEVSRSANKANEDLVQLNFIEAESVEEMEDFTILDAEHVASLREKYCIQCLEILGEYIEALGPILHEKGVDVCLALLQSNIKDERASDNMTLLPEVLKLICALAAHRKFAALFVDRGGMQKLLSVQRVVQNFLGLSSCLSTIGSLQGIMERVCALPSDAVNQIVELALQLLECSQDQARKNAAIFFAAAFVFRAILDSFDAQEGLQKMLNLLHGAASVRSGGNSGPFGAPNTTLRNERSSPEVLTASEKQIAYHTCVALRQYFRAHLLLLVDSLRPNKGSRCAARNASSVRQAYKPLDISNEAMDMVFLQIQRDRKIGPAFVRARWPSVDKFLASNGHITMLELCQAPPIERYLHDLAQYALGILHLITFVPYSRKLIVNATLSNNRVGMAVVLDAANGAGFVGPEVIHPALNLLVNLVCPPPSISNKPSPGMNGQHSVSAQTLGASSENRERHPERNISVVPSSIQNELQSHSVERAGATALSAATSSNPQTPTPAMSAGVVGDRRISLGPGAGCAGLAAQLEQGYRHAREAVRANNGIKVILHLLHPRMITSPAALDCIRALACRVLLGLARDDVIAHILTKLQVGKKLSELIRDTGSQPSGTEQERWQSELAQVAIELIAIVTNSGRASTLAATDAAAPTLRRIERAAIAAATPISYHSRELLQLIHEHLQASGFTSTAALLQKEADFTPLPSSGAPPPALHQTPVHETSSVQFHWPSGRASAGFCSNLTKTTARDEDTGGKSYFTPSKKLQAFSSSFSHGKCQLSRSSSNIKQSSCMKSPTAHGMEIVSPACKFNSEMRTPILLPIKRKFTELKEPSSTPAAKRLTTTEMGFQTPDCQLPTFGRRNFLATDPAGVSPTVNNFSRDAYSRTTFNNMPGNNSDVNCSTPGLLKTSVTHPGMPADMQPGTIERMTLDSLVVNYLKHQHRQCPAPITTLPPLSLLHPHVCPEPRHGLNAPANVTARIGTREFRKRYGGMYAHRRDRHFIYSRFRPCRPCRDDTVLLSCITFLGDSSRIATGSHSGDLKIFDTNNGNILESQLCHQTPVTRIKSSFSGDNQLILSSGLHDVKLWDASSISGGPLHSFEVCKAANFSHSGANFAALSSDITRREVLLYDIQTCNIELSLPDTSNGSGTVRGNTPLLIHFNPSDTMILWNGILWDRRSSNAVHRFDQFTDYGGGGFHPSGNEVIINSEVWDLRKFKLLRTVPSLDQTVITFNGSGDIIYAILRRNIEDITSAVNTRRVRHPLFPAFRTIDAVNYSDIATVQVDRCILDLARDPTDSLIGVISMDDHEEMFSSARLYEVGRKKPTDDDSDPDDGGESDEEDDENDESDADVDPILGADLDEDGDSDSDMSNDEDDEDVDSVDELDEDGDFSFDDENFEDGQGFLDIITDSDEGDEEDVDIMASFSSEDEGGFAGNRFAF